MRTGQIFLDVSVASTAALCYAVTEGAAGEEATRPVRILGSHVGEQAWMQDDNMLEGLRVG